MVSLVVLVNQVLRDLLVILATPELVVHLELLVLRVLRDSQASRVIREQPVYEVRQAPQVKLGPRGRSVSRDSRVLRVMPDQLVQLVNQVRKVRLVMLELLEHQVRSEPRDLRARLEPRASRDPVVHRDLTECLEQLEHQVQRVHQDHKVFLELLELQVKLVTLDNRVSLDL